MNERIEIIGMKEVNKGNLIAIVSIKVSGLVINQMRIIQLNTGLRVDVPLLHWIDRGGHYYEKAIELNNELLEQIEKEVINEYRRRKKR
jgi:DNA-binding cell septation regulator SpoVG